MAESEARREADEADEAAEEAAYMDEKHVKHLLPDEKYVERTFPDQRFVTKFEGKIGDAFVTGADKKQFHSIKGTANQMSHRRKNNGDL